ncbi:MAG: protein kinase domain-containing protein, partial [Gammaproteobacteria bacterium]
MGLLDILKTATQKIVTPAEEQAIQASNVEAPSIINLDINPLQIEQYVEPDRTLKKKVLMVLLEKIDTYPASKLRRSVVVEKKLNASAGSSQSGGSDPSRSNSPNVNVEKKPRNTYPVEIDGIQYAINLEHSISKFTLRGEAEYLIHPHRPKLETEPKKYATADNHKTKIMRVDKKLEITNNQLHLIVLDGQNNDVAKRPIAVKIIEAKKLDVVEEAKKMLIKKAKNAMTEELKASLRAQAVGKADEKKVVQDKDQWIENQYRILLQETYRNLLTNLKNEKYESLQEEISKEFYKEHKKTPEEAHRENIKSIFRFPHELQNLKIIYPEGTRDEHNARADVNEMKSSFASEFIEEGNAEDYEMNGSIKQKSYIERLDSFIKAIDELIRIHDTGVIHCDLTLGNTYITKNGVKFLDTEFSRVKQDIKNDAGEIIYQEINEEMRCGTLRYAPPEIITEDLKVHPLDEKSDEFSFTIIGAVLLGGDVNEIMAAREDARLDGAHNNVIVKIGYDFSSVKHPSSQFITKMKQLVLERMTDHVRANRPELKWVRDIFVTLRDYQLAKKG